MESNISVVKWLTCIDVTPADYPWIKKDEITSQRHEVRGPEQSKGHSRREKDDNVDSDSSERDVEMLEQGSHDEDGSEERTNARRQRSNRRRRGPKDYDDVGSETEELRDHWRKARDALVPNNFAHDYQQTVPWEDLDWREAQRQRRIAKGMRPVYEHSSDEEHGWDRHRPKTEVHPGWESKGAEVEEEDELEEEAFEGADQPGWFNSDQ